MTITSSFPIGPSIAASDVTDENDARNRREAKRKLVSNPPLMRQAERKNSEKLLSEAMQFASNKAQRQSLLERETQSLAQRALKSNHAVLDSTLSDRLPEVTIGNEIKEQSEKTITVPARTEGKLLELADCSKRMLEIESSLVGAYRFADSSEILEKITNFSVQLKDSKLIQELAKKQTNNADIPDHDLESLNCSIDFIEGYCEASSFSDELKKKISYELNELQSLLNSFSNSTDASSFSAKLPDSAIVAIAVQVASENAQKPPGSKPGFDENKSSADIRKQAKNREDTLPLATLRSI